MVVIITLYLYKIFKYRIELLSATVRYLTLRLSCHVFYYNQWRHPYKSKQNSRCRNTQAGCICPINWLLWLCAHAFREKRQRRQARRRSPYAGLNCRRGAQLSPVSQERMTKQSIDQCHLYCLELGSKLSWMHWTCRIPTCTTRATA